MMIWHRPGAVSARGVPDFDFNLALAQSPRPGSSRSLLQGLAPAVTEEIFKILDALRGEVPNRNLTLADLVLALLLRRQPGTRQ
jgi:hypothetical protein